MINPLLQRSPEISRAIAGTPALVCAGHTLAFSVGQHSCGGQRHLHEYGHRHRPSQTLNSGRVDIEDRSNRVYTETWLDITTGMDTDVGYKMLTWAVLYMHEIMNHIVRRAWLQTRMRMMDISADMRLDWDTNTCRISRRPLNWNCHNRLGCWSRVESLTHQSSEVISR